MRYRDALEASKGCPKCCSKTYERFTRKPEAPAAAAEPEYKPEEKVVEVAAPKKAPYPRRR